MRRDFRRAALGEGVQGEPHQMAFRRARKRPRVRSLYFGALWWIAAREAAYAILAPDVHPAYRARLREEIERKQTPDVIRWASAVLARHPERVIHAPVETRQLEWRAQPWAKAATYRGSATSSVP